MATIICVITTILCLWLPKKHPEIIALSVYLLSVALVSVLIFTSGGTVSPFISAWLAVASFAGFFGIGIAGIVSLLAVAQIALSYINQPMELPLLVGHIVFGIAPVVLGFILWHRQPGSKKSDHSFRDLANKLSSVEGKSDIVINSIDDGVVSIDRSGIIDLINPAAETLLGWNQGDALGLDWRSVFKLADNEGREVAEADNPIAQSLQTNQPVHNDYLQLVTTSDKHRLVSIVSSPVDQNEGGTIVVFRDITKEKAEEREQAEFISTASHEMRTPVASIEGYLGLALNPATAQIDEKARDYINKAHDSAKHLGELFQNLLDISKSEDGRLKNNPEVIDIVAMIGDIFEGLEPMAREKGLSYVYRPNPSLDTSSTERKLQPVFYAYVDPSHLREVTANLIENAIKYTPRGDVIVDVSGDDKFATISIQDSGIGIPAEDLPHLFQKFYRVDNTDTREIGGTGLGLYLCRRLAEAMGGGIRVESTYKQGSTFLLDIPRISHEEAMDKINQASDEQPAIIHEPTQLLPIEQTQQPTTIQSMPTTIQPATPVLAPSPAETQTPLQPASRRIEVTQTSGSSLEFKIPEQFQNLPFQSMTLTDIENAVHRQPVFEDSGFQPLNILPDSAPQTLPITTQTTTPQTPQSYPVPPRETNISVPPRTTQ